MLWELIGWLLTPISGSTIHVVPSAVAWHGRLMVLAWLFMMPAIFLVARFYKITPKQNWPNRLDNPFWFIWHRRGGYAIGALVLLAMVMILWSENWAFRLSSGHAVLGTLVLALAVIQIAGGYLRGTHGGPVDPFTRRKKPKTEWPGDHFSMTRRRILFEYIHKTSGYILVPLAALVIYSGLYDVDAPRWMWIAGTSVWLICAGAFIRLQALGRCVDTYQAIWGTDPSLPGNKRRSPIGIGIRRLDQKGGESGLD